MKKIKYRYILYLLLICFSVTGVSFSLYRASVDSTDNAHIARFNVSVSGESEEDLNLSTLVPATVDFLGQGYFYDGTTQKIVNQSKKDEFNVVAKEAVRTLTLTNDSEVDVKANIDILNVNEVEKDENKTANSSAFWCYVDIDESDIDTADYYTIIHNKLAEAIQNDDEDAVITDKIADVDDYIINKANSSSDKTYADIMRDYLAEINEKYLEDFNGNGEIESGQSKSITVVFWFEHSELYQAEEAAPNYESATYDTTAPVVTIPVKVTAEQID